MTSSSVSAVCTYCGTTVARSDKAGQEALENLGQISALVEDGSPLCLGAKGQFEGSRKRKQDFETVKPSSPQRLQVDAAIECIGCGVCYSACDVVAWNPDYLGPAALNRAWTLLKDERDGAKLERLRAVAGDAGCHSCHTHMSCTERCPKQLSPTASIAGLKREVLKSLVRGEL